MQGWGSILASKRLLGVFFYTGGVYQVLERDVRASEERFWLFISHIYAAHFALRLRCPTPLCVLYADKSRHRATFRNSLLREVR